LYAVERFSIAATFANQRCGGDSEAGDQTLGRDARRSVRQQGLDLAHDQAPGVKVLPKRDDLSNFEQIQRGLQAHEDEWIYMHRGLGVPGRVHLQADGTLSAPATDEVFMREYLKEWKRLMKCRTTLMIRREP
jgi:hypothetical protein